MDARLIHSKTEEFSRPHKDVQILVPSLPKNMAGRNQENKAILLGIPSQCAQRS